jgi:hypothetical protein
MSSYVGSPKTQGTAVLLFENPGNSVASYLYAFLCDFYEALMIITFS